MKDLESEIKKYLEERTWNKLRPGDLAKSVAIEAGELLELFQWHNPSLDDVKQNKEKSGEIKKELADVLLYCFDMAVLLDFDVEAIIREKLEHVKKKYPAELMMDRGAKDAGTEDLYWKIKREYRKNGQS